MRENSRPWLAAGLAALLPFASCSKEEPSTSTVKPRENPTFSPTAASSAPENGAAMTGPSASGALPPGHPPIGAGETGMPADHNAMMANSAPSGEENIGIDLHMPAEFKSKPARMMTLQVYAAPKFGSDTEDADVAVSNLSAKVPLKMNVDRWCGQFELPSGQTCETAAKQQPLQGSKYPTTLVEISGTYKGSSMMGPQGAPKTDYEMLAAEIVAPDKSYYVKMVGPRSTVEHWKPAFVDAIKAAK